VLECAPQRQATTEARRSPRESDSHVILESQFHLRRIVGTCAGGKQPWWRERDQRWGIRASSGERRMRGGEARSERERNCGDRESDLGFGI
jgi:hypothetical protein